jgi:hypothetical protein
LYLSHKLQTKTLRILGNHIAAEIIATSDKLRLLSTAIIGINRNHTYSIKETRACAPNALYIDHW